MGPIRSTRRGKKEYRRSRIVARTVVRAKQTESMHERSEEVRSSSDVPSGDSHEFRSRGLREEVKDVYSGPVCREGEFVLILRDTRPGINHKLSYDREGRVITVIDGKEKGKTYTL